MNPETKDLAIIFTVYIAVMAGFLVGAMVLQSIPGGL